MARTTRVAHDHIFQIAPEEVALEQAERNAADGQTCPACDLIRPFVMDERAWKFLNLIDRDIYGPPLNPA